MELRSGNWSTASSFPNKRGIGYRKVLDRNVGRSVKKKFRIASILGSLC